MPKRKVSVSPGERERIKQDKKRQTINSWWAEFEKSKHYQKLTAQIRYISSFAAYTTREYLFCSAFSSNRDCNSINSQDVKEFFIKTAPHYITVDEPKVFIEACVQWLFWLCRQSNRLTHAKEIEKELNRIQRDALRLMESAEGAASKRLVRMALLAGVDPGDDDILQFFIKNDPGSADYYEEFLLPPHPIFHKGRMLYVFDWPQSSAEAK